MTGKKQKSKEFFSDQSESDVHMYPRKKRCQCTSPDSDSESYDTSHEHDKDIKSEPCESNSQIFNKRISSLSKKQYHKHKGK